MRFPVAVLVAVVSVPAAVRDVQAQYRTGLKKYDDQGRLASFTNEDGLRIRVEYEFDGSQVFWDGRRLIGIKRPNGTRIEHAYDERGNLTATRITDGGVTRMLHYKLGDVVSVSSGGVTARVGSWTFVYDHLCRVREVIKQDGRRFAASEDLKTGDVRLYLNKRVVDVLKEDGTVISYAYGKEGTVSQMRIAKPGREAEYRDFDEAGRVAMVTIGNRPHPERADPAAGKPQFAQRSQAVHPPVPVSAAPPASAPLSTLADPDVSAGSPGDGRWYGQSRGAQTGASYFLASSTAQFIRPARTVRAFVSASAAPSSSASVSMLAGSTAPATSAFDPQPYGFAGEPRDPVTGLYYNRARWYGPSTGGFLSMDSFQGTLRQPATLHRYLYASNDPVNRTDPTGRFFTAAGGLASINVMNTINAISMPLFQSAVGAATASLLTRPEPLEVRQLTGVIYAESRTREGGGEDATEKLGVGTTFAARAFYADLCPRYNNDFGLGTIWSAIQTGSAATGNRLWGQVMSGNDLRSLDQLQRNLDTPSKRDHFVLSVRAASQTPFGNMIVGVSGLSNRIPVAFNQASNSPPSGRMERIGAAAAHTFYGFRDGRACQ